MSLPATIPEVLTRSVREFADRPALVWESGTLSFAELDAEVRALARRLRSVGVTRGTRVALIADNGPEWTVGYLAILQAGGTSVPLDPAEPGVAGLVTAARATGVLSGRRLARPGEAAPPPRIAVSQGVFHLDLPDPSGALARAGNDSAPEARSEDVASLLFTSGTTGSPRAVPLTHRNLLAQCEALSRIARVRPGDRTLALVPLFHILGFNVGLMLPLRHGGCVGFLPSLDREALLDSMGRHHPTHLCAVPAVWDALRAGIEADLARRNLAIRLLTRLVTRLGRRWPAIPRRALRPLQRTFGGALHTLVTSGAPFGVDGVRFWKSLGFEVLHAYGLTETAGAVTCTRPGAPASAGVGRPLSCVELRLDERGEVLVRGDTVMRGYEGGDGRSADAGATRFDGGWLRTGDLGRLDACGNLHLLGRAREAIVRRGGETVYPEPVEELLSSAEYVSEVALVGSGPLGDERPVAIVVPDREQMVRRGVLDVFGSVRYAVLSRAARLAPAQRPVAYRIVPEPLPRTPTRKLRRVEIRRRLEAGEYGWGPEAATARARPGGVAVELGDDPAARAVGRALGDLVRADAGAVTPSRTLGAELGLDSLDRINLVCSIESTLGLRLGERAIQAQTVADLLEAARTSAPGIGSRPLDVLAPSDDEDARILLLAERTARRFGWARTLLLGLFRAAATAAFDVRVEGLAHVPRRGAFMLCSNHQSYLDPYFLIPALPAAVRERLWIVAVNWLFRGPLSRTYLYTARTLPMDNLGRFLPGLRLAARVLERGEGLLIFPEGMRSFDGRVGPWRPGAGMIVQRTPVPMVPVAIAGVYQVLPPGTHWPRLRESSGGRPRIRIAIGKPVLPEPVRPGEDGAAAAQRTMDRLRDRVLDLMASFPPEIRPADMDTALATGRAAGGTLP